MTREERCNLQGVMVRIKATTRLANLAGKVGIVVNPWVANDFVAIAGIPGAVGNVWIDPSHIEVF